MKSAICEKPQSIVIKNIEEPKFKADEILIKVKSVGISRLDIMAYINKYPKAKYPIVLGHEFYGEIVAKGKKVTDFDLGDDVIVEPLLSCGKCAFCQDEKYSLCKEKHIIGFDMPGALAEYISVNASLIHRKNESMSSDEATLITPLSSSIHAIKQNITIGDLVVIFGAGYIGLITLQVAKRIGASVIVIDEDTEKLHLSADFDADYVLNPQSNEAKELIMALTKDLGAKFIIECSGNPKNLENAISLVRKGGKIILMSPTGNDFDQISLSDVIAKEISLSGSMINCQDFSTAIDLVNSGAINLNPIISHNYEFDEIPKAFEEISQEPSNITKAVIKFVSEED